MAAEFVKRAFHAGQPADLYFWRDSSGHEVDLLWEQDGGLQAVEIKSGATLAPDWFAALRKWRAFAGDEALAPWLIYGGEQRYPREGVQVLGWRGLADL